MNKTEHTPTYILPAAVDALILAGKGLDPEYHCLGCKAFGWGWVDRCAACGADEFCIEALLDYENDPEDRGD